MRTRIVNFAALTLVAILCGGCNDGAPEQTPEQSAAQILEGQTPEPYSRPDVIIEPGGIKTSDSYDN